MQGRQTQTLYNRGLGILDYLKQKTVTSTKTLRKQTHRTPSQETISVSSHVHGRLEDSRLTGKKATEEETEEIDKNITIF